MIQDDNKRLDERFSERYPHCFMCGKECKLPASTGWVQVGTDEDLRQLPKAACHLACLNGLPEWVIVRKYMESCMSTFTGKLNEKYPFTPPVWGEFT